MTTVFDISLSFCQNRFPRLPAHVQSAAKGILV